MRPLLITLFGLFCTIHLLYAQEFVDPEINEEIDQQITIPYTEAFSTGKVEMLLSLCTPQTVIYNGDNSTTIGVNAISSRFNEEFEIYTIDMLVSGNERIPLADGQVMEIGNFQMDYEGKNGEDQFSVHGDYTMILQKVTGKWKILRFVNHNRGIID